MELKLKEEFYLAISNGRLFPNCLVHAKCISQKDSVGLTFMNFQRAIEHMYDSYTAYKSQYKTWHHSQKFSLITTDMKME